MNGNARKTRNENTLRLRERNYHDLVYGDAVIDDPAAIEIINSPAMQRLKGVDQAGYLPTWIEDAKILNDPEHSRFAHSVGVYLLLKKFGAPREEQIAGLTHDVSHTAFSHAIDYVLASDEARQNYQDKTHEAYVRRTDLPLILSRHGFDLKFLLDETHFPLKETELPDLCADRIDYILRDGIISAECDRGAAADFIKNLTVKNSQWVFKDFAHAEAFAAFFIGLSSRHYSGPVTAALFQATAEYLKSALEKKYITINDLYTTDQAVRNLIAVHFPEDAEIKRLHSRLTDHQCFVLDTANFTNQVFCKGRAVDPLFQDETGIMRVSEKSEQWAEKIQNGLKPKEYYIRFTY